MTASPRAWPLVKWSEAGQVVAQLDDVAIAPPDADLPPRAWWVARVDAGELGLAVRFLAVALPRFEAVAWALHMIERAGTDDAAEHRAIDAVARWLDSPDDLLRRDAWALCEPLDGAVRFLGAALFFSGGSIAPAELEAVHPEPGLCGTAAAGAILAAAYHTPDPQPALADALAAGDRLAEGER